MQKKIQELKEQQAELEEQLAGLDDFIEDIDTQNYEQITSPVQNFQKLYSAPYGRNFESQRSNLNKQYDHPEIIEIKDSANPNKITERIEIVDLKPENQQGKTPLTYVKGFASGNAAYRNLLIDIAMDGNRVIAMDNPHGIDNSRITSEEKDKALQTMEKLHDIELRKAAMLLETLDQKGIKQTDIVAHSEGAVYAVIAALMRPDLIRNIVLINPAGMIGQDKPLNLAQRSIDDVNLQGANISNMEKSDSQIGSTAKENARKGMLTWVKTWFSGPKKNIDAISAIADSQIAQALQFLRQEYGTKVGIIHAVDDKIYPVEWIREDLSKNMVDGSYSIKGTHTSFANNPAKFAPLINDLLKGLERKRQKSEEDRPLDSFL